AESPRLTPSLALDAPLRRGIGLEPLARDLAAAVLALAVHAVADALQRRLDVAQLAHFAVEQGEVHGRNGVGDRFLAGVAHAPGDLAQILPFGPHQRVMDAPAQRLA